VALGSWFVLPSAAIPQAIDALASNVLPNCYTVDRIGGRNTVWRLTEDGGWRYIVKQFGDGPHDAFHYRIERDVLRSQASTSFPELIAHDDVWHILLLKAYTPGLTVDLLATEIGPAISLDIAAALNDLPDLDAELHPGLPGLLGNWEAFADLGLAARRIVDIGARDEALSLSVNRLRNDWQSRHFIHGDLKIEHVLRPAQSIRIIDWETATRGPLEWDWGGILQSLITASLRDEVEWDSLAPSFGALLAAAGGPSQLLADCVAVRLVQTCVEREGVRPRPRSSTARLLQIASRLAAEAGLLDELAKGRGP
jgi:hypothetical protein